MATNKFIAKLQEIQKREGNKRCIDCNAPNPQWASIPFGILFCLECSGKHRALGVHISFVRSITMDKWSEQQVKKMDLGGNKNALDFFKSSPDYSEGMSIEDKYSSEFAQNYREKLAAECDGKTWTPSSSTQASSTSSPVTTGPKKTLGGLSPGIQRAESSGSAASRRPGGSASGTPRNSGSKINSRVGSQAGSRINSQSGSQVGSPSAKAANEEYFARLGEANDTRPDNLPPSQGGKYTGFGNTPEPSQPSTPSVPDIGDLLVDPVGALSRGWSLFSIGASSALGQAAESARSINSSVLQPATERLTENVLRPAAETVRDPEFQGRVTGYVSSLTRSVQDTGSKGLSYLSDYLQTNPQTYGRVGLGDEDEDEKNNENDDWGYGDEDPDADFSNSASNFKPYRDDDGEEEEQDPESDTKWQSTDRPSSGTSSAFNRFGSSSSSPANSANGAQQRRGKSNLSSTQEKKKGWGDDDDEWSKF